MVRAAASSGWSASQKNFDIDPRDRRLFNDVSMPDAVGGRGRVPTNQSPSCNWKRQRLVRSEDSRLNYRRNTIYWKLSHRHRPCTLDIPPVEGNMLTICKEKRCRLQPTPFSSSLLLLPAGDTGLVRPVRAAI